MTVTGRSESVAGEQVSSDYANVGDASLADDYERIRRQTERLAAPLSPEDQMVQSMPEASPTKWHLAHTTWFFETFLLANFAPHQEPFRAGYEVLFNSYYNSVGAQFPRAKRGMLSRPTVREIAEYRKAVDEAMGPLLVAPRDEVRRLITLGLYHEQQHQELLLTDIKHALFQNPSLPAYFPASCGERTAERPSLEMDFVRFEGGTVEIGCDPALGEFSFDNEGPRHRVLLADFDLATRPLCNADVLAFIEAGGYSEPLLWLSDGWSLTMRENLEHPLYFSRDTHGQWHQFTLRGLEPINPNEPACHLSYFEADALARFFGARLPTEFEWEYAASCQEHAPAAFDIASVHPKIAPTQGRGPLRQMLGGVWEWTQSSYAPYPGFQPAPGAVGEYNGKFMHGQMVLRGGSCATPDGHIRPTYRNFFPAEARWQFSGARLAKGNRTP